MSTSDTQKVALRLYRHLLRTGRKFVTYNYRNYAYRHINHIYEQNRNINDYNEILKCLQRGRQELDSLKRQVITDRLYSTTNTVHNTQLFRDAQEKYG